MTKSLYERVRDEEMEAAPANPPFYADIVYTLRLGEIDIRIMGMDKVDITETLANKELNRRLIQKFVVPQAHTPMDRQFLERLQFEVHQELSRYSNYADKVNTYSLRIEDGGYVRDKLESTIGSGTYK